LLLELICFDTFCVVSHLTLEQEVPPFRLPHDVRLSKELVGQLNDDTGKVKAIQEDHHIVILVVVNAL